MSYNKKHFEKNADIKEEWDLQEDRIENEFNTIKIESGSYENGSWTKFPDGTMLFYTTPRTINIDLPNGGYTLIKDNVPPAMLTGYSAVASGSVTSGGDIKPISFNATYNLNEVNMYYYNQTGGTVAKVDFYSIQVIGKWK